MSPPRDGSNPPGALGKYTPDRRRWRRRVAGLAAVGAALAFYGAFAVASGVKSGMVYNVLILLFGVLSLVLPVVATAALLAPDSGIEREGSSDDAAALETLKQRYAAGEIDRPEFERRLDDLVAVPGDAPGSEADGSTGSRSVTDRELDRAEN